MSHQKPPSRLTKAERDIIDFSLGKKKPRTVRERKLAKSIQEIVKQGGIIEVPND
jgi:hypothetical protein